MLTAEAPPTGESHAQTTLPSHQAGGHQLLVAERERVQILSLPTDDLVSEGVSSKQRLAFEQGSNLLGLCTSADRILIADVSKNRVAVLRMTDAYAAVRDRITVEQVTRRIELRKRRRMLILR